MGKRLELVFTTIALFIVTIVASYIFYKRIKMAQAEYEGSKESVMNITSGFTRQVKKMESGLQKIEGDAIQAKYMASEALKAGQGTSAATLQELEKVKTLSGRVENIESSIEKIRGELQKLASLPRAVAPAATPVDAPIPVQGEDIFQRLTDTELEVLQMIMDLDEGSVPEIRDKINKTREHTARLLKKLYDSGFIDRNTNSMPYRYAVRKEIRDLLLEKREATIGL
jgi:multidrug efflux pump subunit AcrB